MKNEFLLSPEEMEKYPDIKIIKELPPMEVAYCVGRGYCAEFDSQKVLLQWLKDNHLEKKGYRIFGFDNGGLGEDHTYETWFAFGEDISGYADSRVRVKTFSGGQYAVMSTKLEQIESAWQRFGEWLHNSRFEHGGHQYLEEHLPGNGEEINENTRMDLYMPIRERETHSELPSTRPLVFEEPKLIEKAAFTLIGLKCDTSEQEEAQNHKVAKTWDRFNKKEHRKIRDIEDTSGGYGVFLYPPVQDGTYSYICGFHTKDSAEVPEGMVSHQQPGSRYAVFTYKSPIRTELDMSGVFAMYAHIFGQWLPTSHYRFDERSHTFEYYQRHRMMRDFPEFDIYVPVV